MTDRELLELAAKAAGIEVLRSRLNDFLCGDMLVSKSSRNPTQQSGPWNPLADDGDALRLAVKLGIDVNHGDSVVVAERVGPAEAGVAESKVADPYAATRRAIVRAAAEIGRLMP